MSVSLAEHRLGSLRWIVLSGSDREAFGTLGEHVRAELVALAEGNAGAQRPFERARF